MRIIIMSVPHTGTNFCKRLFRNLGWEDVGINAEPRSDDAFWVGHIRHDELRDLALKRSKANPLICPFRHPYRVEESWRRQNKKVSEMVNSFRLMMSDYLPLNPYIMPVDSQFREQCLEKLSDGLGLKLATNWDVVNTKAGTHEMRLEEFDPSEEVKSLVADMDEFLSIYYPKPGGEDGRKRKKAGDGARKPGRPRKQRNPDAGEAVSA